MSELAVVSQGRALVGEIRRQQVMDVVRGAAFIGALLVAWISLRPFVDLREQELKDSAATGNETMTYLVFGGLTVLTVLLALVTDRGPQISPAAIQGPARAQLETP